VGDGGSRSPESVAEEQADVVGILVGDGEVGVLVAVEVTRRDGDRALVHRMGGGGREPSHSVSEQHADGRARGGGSPGVCEGEDREGGYGSRRSYGRRRWEDGLDEEEAEDLQGGDDAEDYELLDRIDRDLELRHFVDLQGKAASHVAVAPAPREVCFTRASRELSPFKSEHEGWMGSHGNTVERWYHRAAVLMWPRERNFVIRAKGSPEWALGEILAQIRAGALREAAEKARSLLPFWSRVAPREPSAAFCEQLLHVLDALSNSNLSSALLAPLGPHVLLPKVLPMFVSLTTRHGSPWAKQVFSAWAERSRYDAHPWLPILPGLCTELIATQTESARELERWLLDREVSAYEDWHEVLRDLSQERRAASASRREREDLLALFDRAAVLSERWIRERLLTFLLAPATELPLLSAGELLRA
jgi:hypothetical protein